MSIVEKALRKIQLTRERADDTAAAAKDPVIGKVAQRQTDVADASPAAGPRAESAVLSSRPIPPSSSKIVHIDRNILRAAGLLPPESEERQLGSQYRAIKRPLIRNAFAAAATDEGISRQLIMVASALPGEGKTFTTINMALSMSLEKDHCVLLVDADVAKPHVSRVFGVDQEPGLLDVLVQTDRSVESALHAVILPTDIPRLYVLPAGRYSETASELLSSERMQAVMRHLAARDPSGIVLLDSPPVLLTNEARVLASLAGQVVLVIKAGSTPQQALKDTLGLLEGAQGLSLILNQAELSGPMGYYYGYHYGYNAQYPEKVQAAEPQSSEPS